MNKKAGLRVADGDSVAQGKMWGRKWEQRGAGRAEEGPEACTAGEESPGYVSTSQMTQRSAAYI